MVCVGPSDTVGDLFGMLPLSEGVWAGAKTADGDSIGTDDMLGLPAEGFPLLPTEGFPLLPPVGLLGGKYGMDIDIDISAKRISRSNSENLELIEDHSLRI